MVSDEGLNCFLISLEAFLRNLLALVEGSSIFVMPRASQNFFISLQDWAFSNPYFSSLQRWRPSFLMSLKRAPKVRVWKGILSVAKFCWSLARIFWPKSLGRPFINLSFQNPWVPSSLVRTFVRKTSLYQQQSVKEGQRRLIKIDFVTAWYFVRLPIKWLEIMVIRTSWLSSTMN